MYEILNAGWPALLATISFLLNMNLSNPLFGDLLSILQALAWAAECLTLPMPYNAFLTTLAKATLPHMSLQCVTNANALLIRFVQKPDFGPH
jgi:hypothetical protein